MPTTPSSDNLTPMMRQYFSVKEHHKDHILMWRLGDFYEMFFDDATLASREIGLTLTGRDCGLSERAPMCGVPHHSVEGYIAKLIKKGFKVAICEQMEEASAARGVVSREVVRVITPGTLMESGLLDEESNNYLCAINLSDNACGFVFADISTGIMIAVQLKNDTDEAIIGELSRYSPREVIFPPCFVDRVKIAKYMREKLFCTADLLEAEYFERSYASAKIEAHFGKTLEQLGLDAKPLCIGAAGALLTYLESTQKTGLERLVTVNTVEESRYMNLDSGTRSNLELLETQRSREKRGSLLWVLDRTRTPMGKRLIKNIITTPLMSPAEIERRLSAVGELCANELKRSDIYAELSGVLDVERLLTRIVYGSATPREYKSLELAINKFPQLKSLLANSSAKSLLDIHRDIDELRDLHSVLQSAIVDDPPINIRDGGVIRTGYNADLDTLRELMGNVREILAKLESAEREKTGIKNLKIGYNKVFGYYLEVTRSYQHLVPEHYIRKQTLANNERYITQELKDLEERILTAGEQAVAIETALFEQVRAETARQLHRLQRTAQAIALLDVLQSFATAALEHGYIRPEVSLSDEIDIIDGRHPVVERMQKDGLFVPNDTKLNCRENQISIITGPNMAGKSTYMRQTALIVIMAQIGSFVPAKSARIGIVDGVYTRIGASDDLGAGQSTFMVEMSEVAQILAAATHKSLLILDEIGRGTSTYDGMSIARAVIEYISDPKKVGAKTLFATHYHELTEIESEITCVKNYNIAAKKRGTDVIFLRKIIRGGADESFGVEVSKLAGIPEWIVLRAKKVLEDLESSRPVREAKLAGRKVVIDPEDIQISFGETIPSEVEARLREVDLNTLSPYEAQQLLFELKKMAGS